LSVPRNFFNVRRSGVLIRDPEGDDLPDMAAAYQLGLEIVRDMLVPSRPTSADPQHGMILVKLGLIVT
jgi:hypothetical protein